MSKIALITLVDFDNYGNRLQNYALEKVLTDMGNFVTSIVPYKPNLVKWSIKKIIKRDNESLKIKFLKIRRLKEFLEFDNHYVNTYSINSNDYINIPKIAILITLYQEVIRYGILTGQIILMRRHF